VVTTRTYNSLGSVVSQSRVIGSASAERWHLAMTTWVSMFVRTTPMATPSSNP
jgi:hypothetical protein